jgi:FkbM family methyltransferase
MLMDLATLIEKHALKIEGVLHVGAHLAEEAADYRRLAVGPVTWVEANPAVQEKIRRKIARFRDQRLIQALVTDVDGGSHDFNVTNYDGMSSSIYEFGSHPEFSPDTVFVDTIQCATRTIDSLVDEHGIRATFLNMDIQGAEGLALAGAEKFIAEQATAVMLEVNDRDVYVGCSKVWDLDTWLSHRGFHRVETHWVDRQGWGDALWVKR